MLASEDAELWTAPGALQTEATCWHLLGQRSQQLRSRLQKACLRQDPADICVLGGGLQRCSKVRSRLPSSRELPCSGAQGRHHGPQSSSLVGQQQLIVGRVAGHHLQMLSHLQQQAAAGRQQQEKHCHLHRQVRNLKQSCSLCAAICLRRRHCSAAGCCWAPAAGEALPPASTSQKQSCSLCAAICLRRRHCSALGRVRPTGSRQLWGDQVLPSASPCHHSLKQNSSNESASASQLRSSQTKSNAAVTHLADAFVGGWPRSRNKWCQTPVVQPSQGS